MIEKEKQRWELYLDIQEFIQQYLNLNNWELALTGDPDIYKEGVSAKIEDKSFSHFQANIIFDNRIIFKDEIPQDFEDIFRLLTHEHCHIFTGAGSAFFDKEEHNLQLEMSQKQWANYRNYVLLIEEQMTNILDKVIMKGIKKTKEYKDFNKRFNKIK